MKATRRAFLLGSTAIIALTVARPAITLPIIPRQACGCPRVHDVSYGHTCIVHDETGRRWDAYTIEEIIGGQNKIEMVTEESEWSCYCGGHDDDQMAAGTLCIWGRVSYESDEWECKCAASFRDDWLSTQTIDWIAVAKSDGLAR